MTFFFWRCPSSHHSLLLLLFFLCLTPTLVTKPNNQVAAPKPDRELLLSVARTSLRTKLAPDMAERLTEIVTDAVLTIQRPGQPIDLHMVERMHVSAEVSKAKAQYRRC